MSCNTRTSTLTCRRLPKGFAARIFLLTAAALPLEVLAQTSVEFRQAGSYAASERTTALAVEDFDQDGNLDVASASSAVSVVDIFLGDGEGLLAHSTTAITGGIPVGIAAGAFDADAFPDLILTENESDNMWFLRNRGDGTFATARLILGGHDPWAVMAVDVDRDGNLDAVQSIASETAGRVNVLYGDGAGNFSPPIGARTGGQSRAAVIADINGDGILDAIGANTSGGSISVLRGRGDRSFAPQVESPVGSQPAGIAALDLDGDQQVDVVTTAFAEDSVVFSKGLGGTSLAAPRFHDVGDAPIGLAVADFDRDGRPDVAAANSRSRSVSVLRGDAIGDLEPARSYVADDTPIAVVTADLNEDGAPDLISGSHGDGAGILNVLLARTDGFAAVEQWHAGGVGGALAVADVDRDGLADVAMALPQARSVAVVSAPPAQRPRSTSITTVNAPTAVALADWNDDGRPDLLVGSDADTGLQWFVNQGGQFGEGTVISTPRAIETISVGDYDGGGTLDIAMAAAGVAEVMYLANDDSPDVTTRTLAAPAVASAAGDFNRDGRADLAILTTAPALEVLLGSATGLGQPMRTAVNAAAIGLALLDTDGDDRLDVALARADGSVQLMRGSGNGSFAAASLIPGSAPVGAIASRDVTGDGRADLLLGRSDDETILAIANDGAGGWRPPYPIRVSSVPAAIAAADFDGDGGYDLFASGNSASIASNDVPSFLRGDANLDSTVSAADLVGLLADTSNGFPFASEQASAPSADADGDGNVDRLDISPMIQRIFESRQT